MYTHYHQHLLMQYFTANESIFKCRYGLAIKTLYQKTGDWIGTGHLPPVKTNLPPASENLLPTICCNCKQNFDTKRCSCGKHGLDCSVGCGDCPGVNCTNSSGLADADIYENEQHDSDVGVLVLFSLCLQI